MRLDNRIIGYPYGGTKYFLILNFPRSRDSLKNPTPGEKVYAKKVIKEKSNA